MKKTKRHTSPGLAWLPQWQLMQLTGGNTGGSGSDPHDDTDNPPPPDK